MKSIDVLIKILRERKINGSTTDTGFIIGKNRAVCFQDAPIYSLTQNLLHEQHNREELGGKIRYTGMGLAFPKPYVFERGGRPVFYEKKDIAKTLLPEEEWYRIVNFDISDKEKVIDWTHEREWRLKGDFDFELDKTFVLLISHEAYREFLKKADSEIVNSIRGITILDHVLT